MWNRYIQKYVTKNDFDFHDVRLDRPINVK